MNTLLSILRIVVLFMLVSGGFINLLFTVNTLKVFIVDIKRKGPARDIITDAIFLLFFIALEVFIISLLIFWFKGV